MNRDRLSHTCTQLLLSTGIASCFQRFNLLKNNNLLPLNRYMNPIGKNLTILPTVDSTNNYAMAQLRAGLASSGDVYLAMEQTAGRGQRGNSWQTDPASNIAISIVFQPLTLPIARQFYLVAAVALGCHHFFSAVTGQDETTIKWPNDLYWRDRKAGGILIENIISADQWHWAVIGIGININQTHFAEHLPNPVSLKQITGKDWDVLDMTRQLCACIDLQLWQLEKNKELLLQQYNNVLYKKNQTVRLKKETRIFEAQIKGVTNTGKLITQTSIEELFDFGEIQWVKDDSIKK
jgi:BirA family transcriptional regulator, biotin operon repressor / biotin---[acetyl-CoA-carboxylase] ligase